MKVLKAFAAVILASVSVPAFADPVYIKPGQCIMIGSQQVCAEVSGAAEAQAKPEYLYLCRYGMHADAEVPELKSYQLVQVRVDGGGKIETALRNFGQNGKEDCEKEAAAKTH